MVVIDAATNSVVATVDLGGGKFKGVAVSPGGTRVYAATGEIAPNTGGRVFVVDTATLTVTATIELGLSMVPGGVAVSPM